MCSGWTRWAYLEIKHETIAIACLTALSKRAWRQNGIALEQREEIGYKGADK
jgi:hypothetical protein